MGAVGIWVAAFFTLAIYSFLYRDNPVYKFAEHLLVGVSVGFLIVVAFHDTVVPKIIDPLVVHQQWLVIIPVGLGALMFGRFFPRFAWVSRPALALYIGFGAGVAIPAQAQAYILAQMKATIAPFQNIGSVEQLVNALFVLVGLSTTLSYFYFSKKHEGTLGVAARVGIYFLMVFFGATFGFTVMARISLLIGRVSFLLQDWLHLIKAG